MAIANSAAGANSAYAQRPFLHQFSEQEHYELCTYILAYLTEEEIHWHMNINHEDAQSFFHGHRAYIQRLENFLLQRGASKYVPLPKWDPVRSIPPAFRTVAGRYDQLEAQTVRIPVPRNLRGQQLA